ncbi:MAG: helix-turn-helix domain-containing protein [Candidatus Woesearchaeota archaeon]
MKQKILEEIGLTPSEAKIYLVLLEQGASLAGIISRNTGIHRRSVYDAIERLIQKGLVSYIKSNNRKYFEAVSPDRLLEITSKKEEDLRTILPELKKIQQMTEGKNETLFFRGKAALKSAFDDQLDKAKEICIWGATTRATEVLQYYFPRFDKQRVKKKIKARIIFNETEKDNPYVKSIPLAEVRFVPKEIKSNAAVNIYGRNVCIIAWRDDPVAILVREDNISAGFKSYFEFMWNMAKK